MQIPVLLFAAAKQAAKSEAITVDVPEDPRAADVLQAIGDQVPQLTALLPSCRLAVDCCYVGDDAAIRPGSEVALIPPVSGG